jgi:malonyl-CoA/methylmalonyl-CoA synthetase
VNLTELFDRSLIGRRQRVALEWEGSEANGAITCLTFGDIDGRVCRMTHELAARGLAAGDRLCVQLPNGLAFLDLFLACTRLGVIFVPVNVMYRERELQHIVTDAEPRAFVVARGATPALPPGTEVWEAESLGDGARARPATRSGPRLDGATPAVIIYTSGTTGAAKGAVLSHGSLAANGMNVVEAWRVTDADRFLAVLPLFHVHGLGNGVHGWLISGCLMRLVERFDHRRAASLFAQFRPTLFFGVPTIYHRLLDADVVPDDLARGIGASARLFVSGSAPLPAQVLAAFSERFGHTILERYGMTEALMITTNPYDGERRPGTVGVPFPGVELRLVDDDDVALSSGYWRNHTATSASFADGWFRTGDLGVRSPDGYLTLRGRRGDLIISGGFNIYPREIEELLLEDTRVHEAAVAGAPDELRGEVPVAYVVGDAELDVAALEQRCRSQLASFKVPRAFIRLDALPRTALGKVQKHLLPIWRASSSAATAAGRESGKE